tara:strand:- start:2631 stop:3107 length:477 start_codon:yes stop_codon:yes gene_type:complete
MERISFYKVREDAKLPERAHPTDAGADIFYCPDRDWSSKCKWEGDTILIAAGESCLIPTGLKVDLPSGYMLEIKNKSGVATKKRLIVGACVVDAGYTGEIYVNLQNIGRQNQMIEPNQKIAQAVVVPIATPEIVETKHDPASGETSRGSGGFGSTGEF